MNSSLVLSVVFIRHLTRFECSLVFTHFEFSLVFTRFECSLVLTRFECSLVFTRFECSFSIFIAFLQVHAYLDALVLLISGKSGVLEFIALLETKIIHSLIMTWSFDNNQDKMIKDAEDREDYYRFSKHVTQQVKLTLVLSEVYTRLCDYYTRFM